MHDKYDIIYSMGATCGCAMLMNYEGLRTFSGPFDWIVNVNGLYESFAFMMNGFSDFFNYEDFKVRTAPKPFDPRYHAYENIKTGYIFVHDFPKEIPMEESFDAVKKKYYHRIERFYRLITEKDRVLLIWYGIPNYAASDAFITTDEKLIELCEKFCRKMNKTIDFLIIEHTEGVYQPIKRRIADNIVRYNCHTLANNSNSENAWLGNRKLVQPIFAHYKLHVPWSTALKYGLAKPLILFSSNFLFTKNARRNFREKMFRKWKIPEGKR